MKDEKKVKLTEEVKEEVQTEEEGVKLTDEELALVTGGDGADEDIAALVVDNGSGMCK